MPATASSVRVSGGELAYELHGAGDPVVLVHGAWADRRDWSKLTILLRESFRVVCYDRRGWGESSEIVPGAGIAGHARDLLELVGTLDLGSVHVVANSFGGTVALHAAAASRQAFRSLSAHEPPVLRALGAGATAGRDDLRALVRRLDSLAQVVDGDDPQRVVAAFGGLIGLPSAPAAEPRTQLPPAIMQRRLVALREELRDPNALDIDLRSLSKVDMPLQLTNGDRSVPLFAEVADVLAASSPNAQRRTLAGADHSPHLRMPGNYADVVTTFVRAHG